MLSSLSQKRDETKKKTRLKLQQYPPKPELLISLLFAGLLLVIPISTSAQTPEPQTPVKKSLAPDWLLVASPTVGWLQNTTTFPVPTGTDTNGDLSFDDYTMKDAGWGGGLTLTGFYKRLFLTNVSFIFPEINQARLLGNLTYLSTTIPTDTFVEPYLGFGILAVKTDAEFKDFNDTRLDDLGGITLKGFAHMDWISVDNSVLAAYPKLGLRLHIPIQHWHIQPFYSYMVENIETHARSGGGEVELWDYDESTGEITGSAPVDIVEVRAFDKTTIKDYRSHMMGLSFFLDFHYFMQLKGTVVHNNTHDLWTVRMIGSMMLTKHIGLTAYFEHSQKITVTNTFFLIGPAFVFTPEGFFEDMMARRKRAQQSKTE